MGERIDGEAKYDGEKFSPKFFILFKVELTLKTILKFYGHKIAMKGKKSDRVFHFIYSNRAYCF